MLQPTGLAVLHALGLSERILHAGARIDRLHGMAGRQVVLDVKYAALGRRDAFGLGIHRASLFSALHEAIVAHGIPIETGRLIEASRLQAGRRYLLFQDGSESAGFDLVVDALGTWSSLAPPCGQQLAYGALWASLDWPDGAGFEPNALTQRYRRSSTMAGVMPMGMGESGRPQAAFFWSLRAEDFARWQAAGLDRWKSHVETLWPATRALLLQIGEPSQLTFARYAHRTLAEPSDQSLIHIGDAWHSASPQLGQGANMALLDAWSLARSLQIAPSLADGIAGAIAARRGHVRLYQALTWMFTPVYQSDSRILPFVRDRIAGPLSKLWPATRIQAAMVSGLLGNPLSALGLRQVVGEGRQ